MYLFNEDIGSWDDWGRVFQSIAVFEPLVGASMKEEKLAFDRIYNLTPGTNAVFRVGEYVLKIFAPEECGRGQNRDFETEVFALKFAFEHGVTAPRLVGSGAYKDKYVFHYIVLDYVEGREFNDEVKSMSDGQKVEAGRELRRLADGMNVPCDDFNGIDFLDENYVKSRFERFGERFREARLEYIRTFEYGEKVFVHGDLFGENCILGRDGRFYIIDFADAVRAPVCYEYALVAIDFFRFDKYLLKGFFGDLDSDKLAEICLSGILIHNFGAEVIEMDIGKSYEFETIGDLRKRIKELIDNCN